MKNSTMTKNTKTTPINKEKKVRNSNKLLWSAGAIAGGLLLGWIVLIFTGNNPADFFSSMFKGSFGSKEGFGNLLGTLSWMIPVGLALVVSFRAGVFNIGATGQMLIGGIVAYFFAAQVDMGKFGIVFLFIFSAFSGALLSGITAKLKTAFGIHEVISSILLNWVMMYGLTLLTSANFMGTDYWANGDLGAMRPILESNSMNIGWLGNSTLNIGIFIAIPLLIGFSFLYKYTTWGVKQDIIGKNPSAADYIGMKGDRSLIQTMMISGALAGFAGAVFYIGTQGVLKSPQGALPAEGFQGITLSLLAFNSPVGLIGSAMFVGVMENGRTAIAAGGTNQYVIDAVLALAIYGSAIVNFFLIYRPHDKFLNWMAAGKVQMDVVKEISIKTEIEIEKEKVVSKTVKEESVKTKPKLTKAQLSAETVVSLKARAKKEGLKGYSKMSKDQLITLIIKGGEK